MRDANNKITKAWEYYELGRTYNNSLVPNQYSLVNTNTEFFKGNQWFHMPDTEAMRRLPRPVFNIIGRVVQLFVASLASSNTTITFESLSLNDGNNLNDPETDASEYATAEVQNLLEKFKMDYRIRDALVDGAVTGDYCAHFYWNPDALPYGGAFGAHKGEIEMEMVDGINVMFGNPNCRDVEKQPYILIVGRDTVEDLKWEANRFRANKVKRGGTASTAEEVEGIVPDHDTLNQSGLYGQTEVIASDDKTGKALYVLLYTKVRTEEPVLDSKGNPMMEPEVGPDGQPIQDKVDGKPVMDVNGNPIYKMRPAKRIKTSVHVTKATKNAVIYEDVDTGLSRYPIAWGNWARNKNSYHGRALVTEVIPNQIFINQMMAMIFRHLQNEAFPIRVFNADVIPAITNEVGQSIGVRNLQPGQDMRSVITSIQPADMSNQIVMAIDRVMSYTKECLGATDAQMGDIRPDNTSALMVLQSAAEVPLENIRSNLHEWEEDIGAILLDMMGTYYGKRPLVKDRQMEVPVVGASGAPEINPMTGMMATRKETHRVMEEFDFSQFKNLYLNIRVDVGATTYYSEIAMVQTLDNLRRDGTLDIIDYLERMPDKLIKDKQSLLTKYKEQASDIGVQEANMAAQGGTPPNEGAPAMGGLLDPDKTIANMPANIQAKYNKLPQTAQKALVNAASL